jgi:hypothetical protein
MKPTATLSLALLCACAHMQVPAELKSSEIPVDETPGLFSGNLRFGPFRAMEISKGWTHGGGSAVGWFGVTVSETSLTQDYSFRFEEEGQPPRAVACRAAFAGSEASMHVLGGTLRSQDGRETLDCRFGQPGAAAPDGNLRYADTDPAGRLELGGTALEFAPDFQFDGSSAISTVPLGFVVSEKGQPIAAVDRNKTGVWMRKDLDPPRRAAAGLTAAILFIYRAQRPSR